MNPIPKQDFDDEQINAQHEKRDTSMARVLEMEKSTYNSYRVIKYL